MSEVIHQICEIYKLLTLSGKRAQVLQMKSPEHLGGGLKTGNPFAACKGENPDSEEGSCEEED